jgi:AhpD family alkylhydroperoxidase
MKSFPIHTVESAPIESRALLESSKIEWGFVPTLHGILAESPAALEGYQRLFGLVAQRSTLSPAEQQVVYLSTTTYYECEYCTMGHTYLARAAGLAENDIRALRETGALSDPRLQALRVFTRKLLELRGQVSDTDTASLLAAGFTRAHALEIALVIATKTLTAFANHMARTPKEAFMSDPALAWVAPSKRLAEAA